MKIIVDQPTTQQLSISEVEQYLLSKQWHKVTSSNPNAIIFHGKPDINGKPLMLLLPANEQLIDAERRMNDVLRSLSQLEETTPYQVVQNIKALSDNRPAPPTRLPNRPTPKKRPVKVLKPTTKA